MPCRFPTVRRQFISLDGGIGNLLFQYAAARSLAARGGVDIVLAELSSGLGDRLASYVGPLEFPVVDRWSEPRLGAICPPSMRRPGAFVNQFVRSCVDACARTTVVDFAARPSGRSPRALFLQGYFQHPTWFDDSLTDVLDRLASARPAGLPDRLDGVVGVHLRRGDYVRAGWDLPLGYYERALRIAEESGTSTALVVSDDAIVSELFAERLANRGWTTLRAADLGSEGARGDFHLLASCSSIVLSNSTFSWWAAKLDVATAVGRVGPLLVPRHWLGEADFLLDPEWTRID